MDSSKALSRPGYLLALMLFWLPIFDAATAVWPFHLGQERWRFGAMGSFSNMTLSPLLGLLIALILAALLDHRRVRRVIGALCALFAVILAALTVLFILDFFQTRTQILPRLQHAITVATVTAGVKLGLSVLALTLLARAGLSGPKGSVRRGVLTPETSQPPLIPLANTARAE